MAIKKKKIDAFLKKYSTQDKPASKASSKAYSKGYAKGHVSADTKSGYAVGKSVADLGTPPFPGEPGALKVLFSFDQLMQLRDRNLLSVSETRAFLGIPIVQKEESNDTDNKGDESQTSVDKSEGVQESEGLKIVKLNTSNEAYVNTAVKLDTNEADASDTSSEQTNTD